MLFVLGVEPRTEPELVEEVGFFAMIDVCERVE